MSAHMERLSAALAERYRIERELGQGGMATVYLAEDLKHRRRVALKVLKPELAAVLGADRFIQEITTTAALQHPHILPLFDSGEADGFLFYVMPFIDGETLRSKLDRETQLGIDEAVKIASDVADALHYAHTQGVVHRDIKPENILLANGRPMVADFGIALAVSAAAGGRMTETGLSLGTPHYMSPEQATAEKEVGARSDIYSLASVLYEMLAGQPPHLGGSAQQIIMKIIAEQPQDVTALRRSVPANVAAAIRKALEKLPADRFASAAAFAGALTNPAFQTGGAHAGTAPRQRHRLLVPAGAVLLGILLGGSGVGMLRDAAQQPADDRQQLTFNGLAGQPAITPDGDFVAYVETTCEHARVALCRSSLLLHEVGGTQARLLITDALSLQTPRWSHDGLTIVVAGELSAGRAGLFAVPRQTGTVQRIGPSGVYDTHPHADSVMIIPDGAPGRAVILSIRSGTAGDSFPVSFSGASDIAWSPDGLHVAARVGDGIHIFNRSGTVDSVATRIRPVLRWSPAGTALLFFRSGTGMDDQFVRLPMTRDGRSDGVPEVLVGRIPTLYRSNFDIARKTGTLVVETGDANVDLWSFELSGQATTGRRETHGTTWYGYPQMSKDGRAILYFRGDARGDNIYMRDLATGVEEALTSQHLPGGEAVRLSHDGARLVYGHSSDDGYRIEYIEFPSRQVLSAPAPVWADLVEPLSTRGFVGTNDRTGALVVLDSLHGQWRVLELPDSLTAVNFSASPDATMIAVVATTRIESAGPTVYEAGAGGRHQVVGTVPAAGGEFTVLASFPTGEPVLGVAWLDARTLSLARWPDDEDLPGLWRLSISDRLLSAFASLPAPCTPVSITVDPPGRVATCRVDDFRSDIWLMSVSKVTQR